MKMPTHIKEVIIREIPPEIIQTRDGGRNTKLDYISGAVVIDLLNEAFNYMWDWIPEEQWIEEGRDRIDKQTNKRTPQGPVAHVRGKLICYIEMSNGKIMTITKGGYGSKLIVGAQSEQESVFKAADTDALKKAASRLGIGLELYRKEDEQEFFREMSMEDPWTDEMMEKHKEARNVVIEYIQEHGTEKMQKLVEEYGLNGTDDIVPDNIQGFVEFLKSKNQQEKKQDEKKSNLFAVKKEAKA